MSAIPDDIYRHLRRMIAKERAVRQTREQVRRWRVFQNQNNKKPALGGLIAPEIDRLSLID